MHTLAMTAKLLCYLRSERGLGEGQARAACNRNDMHTAVHSPTEVCKTAKQAHSKAEHATLSHTLISDLALLASQEDEDNQDLVIA